MNDPPAIRTRETSSQSRSDQANGRSGIRSKRSTTASNKFIVHTTTMNAPIESHRKVFNGDVKLKWLVVPRAACMRITVISTMKLTADTLGAKPAEGGGGSGKTRQPKK